MNDSGKSPLSQAADLIGENIVNPVKDEVGQALEQGLQTTFNQPKPLTPEEEQKKLEKKQQEQQSLQNWQWYVDREAKTEDEIKQVREQKERAWQQKQQEEKQKTEVRQFEDRQKEEEDKQFDAVRVAQIRTETKRGLGG